MILGSVSLAFAQSFPDTKDTDYDEAATVLTDLEIISGYADGTFKPANSITRAEFAAMMIRGLGFKVAGTSAVTQFSDVEPTYWASTYIKYASELGIIYGYGDGTFRPKNNITNDEAIAMLVRALGYKAQYLSGAFPTSHINVALGLGILDGVPTGSAEATRGDVAQLVFNALGQPTVTYDAQGAIRMGQSMLVRHGAQLYSPTGAAANAGDPFVVTGGEDTNINLTEYYGAFVTAYADADNYIIGVSKVLSEFITGALDDVTVANTTPLTAVAYGAATLPAGSKVGDYKLRTDYSVAAGGNFENFETFTNGVVDVPTSATYLDGGTYTMAVKIDGNYVTKVYSASVWTPNDAAQVSADDLEALEDAELLNGAFTLNTKDEIDTTSFALLGVDKLADIKAGHVVAIYKAGNVATNDIIRVEVGTKTVSGTISRINSALNTVTIGGTTYKMSTLPANIGIAALSTGDKGTFYLDYQGRIYEFEAEDTTHLYGVVLDQNVGAPGLNGATPKVKLYTEEGKTVTYVCVDALADYTVAAPYAWDASVYAAAAGPLAAGDVVDFTLNTSGQVRTMTKVAMPAGTANSTFTKSGTIEGHVLDSKSVLFAFDGTSYSVVKKADVLGKTATTYNYNANASDVVKVAVLNGMAGTEAPSYAFVKWDYVDNENYDFEVFFTADDGSSVSFFTNTKVVVGGVDKASLDGVAALAPAAELYKLNINSTNGIAGVDSVISATLPDADTDGVGDNYAAFAVAAAPAETTCKKQGDVYVLSDGTTSMTLASDVTVFVMSSGTWTVKSTAALKGLDATDTIEAFDLTSGGDNVYDVVFVY